MPEKLRSDRKSYLRDGEIGQTETSISVICLLDVILLLIVVNKKHYCWFQRAKAQGSMSADPSPIRGFDDSGEPVSDNQQVTRHRAATKNINLYGKLPDPVRPRRNAISTLQQQQRERSSSAPSTTAEDEVFNPVGENAEPVVKSTFSLAWDSDNEPSPSFLLSNNLSTSTYHNVSVGTIVTSDTSSDEFEEADTTPTEENMQRGSQPEVPGTGKEGNPAEQRLRDSPTAVEGNPAAERLRDTPNAVEGIPVERFGNPPGQSQEGNPALSLERLRDPQRRLIDTENIPPSERLREDSTRQNMEENKKSHRVAINRASSIWADEYEGIDPSGITEEYLISLLDTASKQKHFVREAILFLEENDQPVFNARLKDAAEDTKKCFLQFIKKGQEILKANQDSARSNSSKDRDQIAAAAHKIKSGRIKDYSPKIIDDLNRVASEIAEIKEKPPDTDLQFHTMKEKFAKICKRAETLKKDARSLVTDCIECGMEEPAHALEKGIRALLAEEEETDYWLTEEQDKFGIVGNNLSSRIKNVDISPPEFRGDSQDKLDFYSFSREWDEYISIKGLSKAEQLRVLLCTSLQGPARSACHGMTDLEKVFKFLKDSYGNPKILFSAKVEEIKKIGGCSGTLHKKREWAMNISTKLKSLNELAVKYELEQDLHHSPVLGEICKSLPYTILKKMKDDLKSNENKYGIVPRKVYFEKLMFYLEDFTDDLTFDINFQLSNNLALDLSKKEKEESSTKHPVKKAYTNTTCINMNDETGSSADPPSKGRSTGRGGRGRGGNNKRGGSRPEGRYRQDGGGRSEGESRPDSHTKPSSAKPATVAAPGNIANTATQRGGKPNPSSCGLCSSNHTHLYYCPKFINTPCRERYYLVAGEKVCFRCLRLDSKVDFTDREQWWERHKADCNTNFPCMAGNCANKTAYRQFHATMCKWHVKANQNIEQDFIKSLNPTALPPGPVKFFFHIYHAGTGTEELEVSKFTSTEFEIIPDITGPSIFMLQNLIVDHDKELHMFYDSGCQGAALSDRAYSVLETETVREGPTIIHVAGSQTIELEHGDERFLLELENGKQKATITGARMKSITSRFPLFSLQEAFEELQTEFMKTNPYETLPKCDKAVGGSEVDIMLGIRYNRYFPVLLYSLPSGLGIYKAQFKSARGCQGILGGPHKAWELAYQSSHLMGPTMYLTREARAYKIETSWVRINQDKFPLTGQEEYTYVAESTTDDEFPPKVICTFKHCSKHSAETNWIVPSTWNLDGSQYSVKDETKRFDALERIGSEIDYRCISCRNCARCRNGDQLEQISLQEEAEQFLIEASVTLNVEAQRLEAKLPFIEDPLTCLKPNRFIAEKVLESQMKIFAKHPEMREDTLKSHNKLLEKGHVAAVSDLTTEEQRRMATTSGDHVIPWRTVYKEGSLSTPCRMVYDASSRTPSGHSLNSVLAKGQNRLEKILHLLLRFRKRQSAISADISMAYNGIKLLPEYYPYQKYLWKPDLDPNSPTVVMVVKTLIYGVKSAGGQTNAGINLLADYCEKNYPEHQRGAKVLRDDIYVDDITASEDTREDCEQIAEDITFTLGLGGMSVKAYTFSGTKPGETVSADGVHVGLVGYLWEPEQDLLKLDIKELFFGKVRRGKRPDPVHGNIADALQLKFTKRVLVGKVNGVYDPLGLVTPVTAKFKLDIHDLCKLNLDWDDPVPPQYLDLWVNNMKDIQSLGEVSFRRAIIPEDAADTNIHLIVSVDASENLAVAAVHARVRLKGGGYNCQLLTAKSKVVSGSTIPRAELKGCVMGSVLGHVARRNLLDQYDNTLFITDSTICLFWIQQDDRPLKIGVRNSVIEIRRFTLPEQWRHVESEDNIADIGTRRGDVSAISEGSDWQCGRRWMSLPMEQMPLKTAEEITLSGEEKRLAATEMKSKDIGGHVLTNLVSKVGDRYMYSKYVVDPCLLSWPKSVRVLAYVNRFISTCRARVIATKTGNQAPPPTNQISNLQLSQQEIQDSQNYFFRAGTREVKHFAKEKDWRHCSVEKEKILYYTGRILDGQEVHSVEKNMIDLDPLTFVKPILDRYSPVAYAIMIFCHSSDSHHMNSISTLRHSRDHCFILRGRDLANEIRESCVHCRRFKKRLVQVEMGKVHDTRLTIAPIFWNVQVDLMGPFEARCEHNHRSIVKVWGVVFKDPASAAVAVFTMQKYDASAFLLAYTRFTSRFGHPVKLFIDEGGQLVKGCKEVEFNWIDIANNLNSQFGVGVEYSTCPVGGHNAHGMVERSIKEVKKLFFTVYSGLRLDILAYETAFAWTSNELNNLPICLGSRYESLEHSDLITPSRLLFGRNNKRSPSGYCRIDSPSRLIAQMDDVYKSWWETWKEERLVDFIPQPPKWNSSDEYEPKPQDIVVFTKDEKDHVLGEPLWRTGRIVSVDRSKDGKVRSAIIEYKNSTENVYRTTRRSIRKVAVLHKEGELELVEELNLASKQANISYLQSPHDLTVIKQRCYICNLSYETQEEAYFHIQATHQP